MENPGYTSNELAKIIGASRKIISNRVRSLKQINILIRIGSDTKGYWEIKDLL